MSESDRRLSRREILALTGGGLVVAILGWLGLTELRERQSPFETHPSLDIDFSSLPDGQPLDPQIWTFDHGPFNQEAQTYTDRTKNVRIENGALTIQAFPESFDGYEYTSGRINTKNKFDLTYGKLVVSARFPRGAGSFAALWLRSTDQTNYQNAAPEHRDDTTRWALNGEIDIAESQGVIAEKVFANCHTKASVDQGGGPNSGSLTVPDMYYQYHGYGVEWTPQKVVFTMDGEPYHSYEKTSEDPATWPFDHSFHLVINLALGGTWAESAARDRGLDFPKGIDDSQAESWVLSVKRITYYPLKKD